MISYLLSSRLWSRLVALVLACMPQVALAAEGTGGLDFINAALAGIFGFLIVIISFFSIIFAMFAGELMSSTYIFGSGMGPTLQLVWEVFRNFVNVAFILILLIIAVMVVLGIGEDKGIGQLKKFLSKFILALVVVNFTFFGARFILTTTDVLATAVFAIPRTISPEATIQGLPCADTADQPVETIEDCFTQIRERSAGVMGGTDATTQDQASVATNAAAIQSSNQLFRIMAEMGTSQTDGWVLSQIDKTSFPLALLMNLMDLKKILWVQTAAADSAADSWGIFIAALGSFVTALVSAIVIFMLFLAFLIRTVVLWVLIAVSPLAALLIVLKEIFPNLPGGDMNLMDEFIKNAFMPVFVAVPLTIGMVMIFANNSLLLFDGSIQSAADVSGNLNALLWWIAAIAIIWIGTNKAIEASGTYAQQATSSVHNFTNGVAKGAAGLLQYSPILPIGQMKALVQAPQRAMQIATNDHNKRVDGMANQLASAMTGRDLTPGTQVAAAPDMRGSRDLRTAIDRLSRYIESTAGVEDSSRIDAQTLQELNKHITSAGGTALTDGATMRDLRVHHALSAPQRDRLSAAMQTSQTSPKAKITSENVVAATGIQSAAAGTDMEPDHLARGTKTGTVTINDQSHDVYSYEGTHYIQSEDGTHGTKLYTQDELNDTINSFSNELDWQQAGTNIAQKLTAMQGLKGTLKPEDFEKIHDEITKAVDNGNIAAAHIDDIERAYKELATADLELSDALRAKLKS